MWTLTLPAPDPKTILILKRNSRRLSPSGSDSSRRMELCVLIFLDTEFNGFHGSRISMALVPEAGRSFYEALHCDDPCPWVAQNVMPIIGKPPISRHLFQKRLSAFLCRFQELHIVADWPEDLVHFCQALLVSPGERLLTPAMQFELIFDISKFPSKVPHNALEDAKAFRLSILHS
jgi:hypothetical protein